MTRVVIEIPDDNKRDIYWVKGKRVANLIGEYKVLAVLPEEYGDLIDRKALKEVLKENEWITNTDGGGLEDIIEQAPTVIEGAKINTSVEDS